MAKGDCFLKLEGIEGESADDQKKNHIEIDSWSTGGSNSGSFDKATGGGTSKVSHQDVHFTKTVDKSSPNLHKALCNGRHIDKATIFVRKAGEGQKDYMTITLSPCMVSSYQVSHHAGGGMPTESFSLNFDKIEYEYKTQDDKGTLGGAVKSTHHISQNKTS
jgi:type VI secretion system secreted protein Hcp